MKSLVGLASIIAVPVVAVIFLLAERVALPEGIAALGMFLEFVPRWLGLLPVLPGVIACWPSRRRLAALGGVTFLYCVFVLDYELPLGGEAQGGATFTVATYNVGGGSVPPGEVIAWYVAEGLDVLFLQEADQNGFSPALRRFGLNTHCYGKLCVATQHGLEPTGVLERDKVEAWGAYAASYRLCRGEICLPIMNVHLETPRKVFELLGDDRVGQGRFSWMTLRRETESAVASLAVNAPDAIIGGDFNMTVNGYVYRHYWGHWANAFSEAGTGFGYTKSGRRLGARIDHILFGSALTAVSADVLPSMGGDHRPVKAQLRLALN